MFSNDEVHITYLDMMSLNKTFVTVIAERAAPYRDKFLEPSSGTPPNILELILEWMGKSIGGNRS